MEMKYTDEMSRKLSPKCKFYIKNFPCTKTSYMKDYLKPPLRHNTNHFLLQRRKFRTNPNPITAKSIVDVVVTLKMKTITAVFPALCSGQLTKSCKKKLLV